MAGVSFGYGYVSTLDSVRSSISEFSSIDFASITSGFNLLNEAGTNLQVSLSSLLEIISGYDILKWVAQYLLPALATLYFAVAKIWGLPYGEEIVGTITAVDTFLGVLLGISTANYNKQNGAGNSQ